QAEDGIRDRNVTGVQTCALPILNELLAKVKENDVRDYIQNHTNFANNDNPYLFARRDGKHYASDFNINQKIAPDRSIVGMPLTRSEERRVGKECRDSWWSE